MGKVEDKKLNWSFSECLIFQERSDLVLHAHNGTEEEIACKLRHLYLLSHFS